MDPDERSSNTKRDPPLTHLGHESVRGRVLLVLEHDVDVVVGRQLLKALGAPGDLALVPPAGAQRLLGHVGAELLVGQRGELLGGPPPAVAPARSAALRRRTEEEEGAQSGGKEEEGTGSRDPHRLGGGHPHRGSVPGLPPAGREVLTVLSVRVQAAPPHMTTTSVRRTGAVHGERVSAALWKKDPH